ncbi:uncharacterized protein LOC132707037 [Cylas formicarius]|uniref:uncharacterized protein LOC132707037 n=1 Tax=Cylas formicarius TaxID=197179 RepID=UPI002958809F|nr:uncharacterized protein LOC132707037 [Cylas formicarius]
MLGWLAGLYCGLSRCEGTTRLPPPCLQAFRSRSFVRFLAQDLRVVKPWQQLPPSLMLRMMLMKQTMLNPMAPTALPFLHLAKCQKPKPMEVQSENDGGYVCHDCGRVYKLKSSLRNHQKWECGKEPQFKCQFCSYRAKQKMHMVRHMERMHKDMDLAVVKKENGEDLADYGGLDGGGAE